MSLELAIANVLEKAAHYIDAVEVEKKATVQAVRDKLTAAIREKVSAVTGEEVTEDVARKLAQADPEILSTIEKLAANTDVEKLGEPSTRHSSVSNANQSVAEQVKLAEERLINFAIS
jgi:hypothetical protein